MTGNHIKIIFHPLSPLQIQITKTILTTILNYFIFSYLYLRNDTPYNIQQWNTTLQKYIQEGNIPEHISTLVHHVVPIKILNLQDQLYFLSSISNYHWWKFIRCDGNKSKSGIHVRLTDHLLYHPISEQSPEELTLKYIPESPRNRLMYYLHKENIYPGCLKLTIAELLKLDISQQDVFQFTGMFNKAWIHK